MSAERLAELRRQRALVQEHLAWLDREIRAAENDPAQPAGVRPANLRVTAASPAAPASQLEKSSAAPVSSAAATGEVNADADAILERFRAEPTALREDVRKGCLLYFIAGCALFAAAVAGLYFALRH